MASESSTAAQRLADKHAENSLQPTVEDIPDEDLKQPAPKAIDLGSQEAFPELGAPKRKAPVNVAPIWSAKTNGKSNGSTPVNGTSRAATPGSGVATPSVGGVPNMAIPGRHVETVTMDNRFILQRNQLKRPIPDVVKDINRKSRAVLSTTGTAGGGLRIDAVGPQDKAQQAIRDLVQQIGTKETIKVAFPRSARAHLIGRQGATIKSIQDKSGARVTLPKDDGHTVDDDEDGIIYVTIEGNTITAAAARDQIEKIARDRSANLTTKLRSIPVEFYPFIAGPNNRQAQDLEFTHGVQIRVPPHQPWSQSIPELPSTGERPMFAPPSTDNHIQLAGDRDAAAKAKAAIEHLAQELTNTLHMDQCDIPRGRHQFIVGDRGMPLEDFFAETNCAIILPTQEGIDTVTIIGAQDDVNRGIDKAMELGMNLNTANVNIARNHKHAQGGAPVYCRDVSRYLRQRRELERLEQAHQVHINTPFLKGVETPWELYARDGKNLLKAQKEVQTIMSAHPPSRLASLDVDPFYHAYFRSDVKPQVQNNFGVHLVIPEPNEAELPVVLVYEGDSASDQDYQVPQKAPGAQELAAFQKGLDEARTHILDLLEKQEAIKTDTFEVLLKYHEKLRKFIKKENDVTSRTAGGIPVRVTVKGTTVTMKGPASNVESLAGKARAFVEQEKEDEKERGFITTFDFPQKFANHLIGKGGSHINELREKFDVEIQLQNGVVELKGPKAKADKARSYINSLARTWADETTHTLKIEPKYHRELIGAQGSQITRLQTRYHVHINFPRTARPAKEDESVVDAASDAGGKSKRQQGPDEVVIRGPKKGADEARDEIFSLYQYLKDNSFTAVVAVQQKQLPSLIGSGGSGMEELRQASGAKIDIPNERNEDQDALVEIQIKGTKSQVAAAKNIIEEKKAVYDDTVAKTVDIDRQWHKILVGPGGSTLRDIVNKAGGPEDRRLQNRCMQIPKPDSDSNTITVEGRRDVVDKIISTIQAMVEDRASQVTETLNVPIEKHRTLIGRGGDAKRRLESEFSVSIDIPRMGSNQTAVKIAGKPAAVEKAKKHISSMIKEQQGETVQVPLKYHNVISDNGQFFRRLRNDHKVTVDHAGHAIPPKSKLASTWANNGAMPLITDETDQSVDAHSWNLVDSTASTEEGEIPWVLKGNQEAIDRAKKAIAKAIEQAQKGSFTGYLILPDPSTYRYVIGKQGSKVDSIRQESGCKITVPRDQRDEAIEITGSREGCETARDLILEAVREGLASRQRD